MLAGGGGGILHSATVPPPPTTFPIYCVVRLGSNLDFGLPTQPACSRLVLVVVAWSLT